MAQQKSLEHECIPGTGVVGLCANPRLLGGDQLHNIGNTKIESFLFHGIGKSRGFQLRISGLQAFSRIIQILSGDQHL